MRKLFTIITGIFLLNVSISGQVFITELADPNNNAGVRYIELYNAGASAVDFTEGSNWRIDKYTNASATVSQTLNLSGIIPAGGFYIIATGTDDGDFFSVYGVNANQFDGADNDVAGSNGDDNLELYDGTGTLIDQFGVPGEDGSGTAHEFEDGRAERVATVTSGNSTWDTAEWNIDNDSGGGEGPQDAPADFDPGAWIGAASTIDPEPTNHATGFTATSNGHNQIDLSWTDATGAQLPAGYLIKGSDVSFAAITAPVDGTPEADAGLIKNVAQGVQAATITGLTETTQYFFKIFPYTNSGATIDYKTDGTVPQDDATTDAAPSLPNAWINEFHYDDVGADSDEFVEIIIEDGSAYTLSDFQVNLYNGNGGVSYNSRTLDTYTVGDIINESGKTFNLYSFNYTSENGIQNGAPDGLALSYQGTLIQFLSYEGTFAATDGPANGVMSTDIGISESGTSEGSSLGLEGNGTQYSDFTWVAFDASATPGSQNGNQALPVELTSFSASVIKNSVKLVWNTATEINNYGFEIQRSADKEVWSNVGFINGSGTTNAPKEYSYVDSKLSNSSSYYYRLKQVDNDGSYEYSKTIEVVLGTPTEYELGQNYPNPFNPSTLISFTLPEAGYTSLIVYNSLGQEVAELVNNQLEAGSHQYNFDAKNLTSGIYFYKLESENFVQVRKMMLLK
ncbi:MAG: T9SS type A sorting domain-containing protein [Ignavibacteriae bacterium]|nr:T9SS C-terminal target domain-containing protein [Ignavibacteriota bacterium]NOG97019.1 T9SS type A sorting domain-containing protein [Ignavibacteriota bacterium]